MHQGKKGNQWYFGMKAHVGIDADTKLIHSAEATAANVADSRRLPEFLHGEETDVWGDQAYQGKTEVIQQRSPRAVDRTPRRYRTRLVCYPAIRNENRQKSRTRSRVEHLFALIKLKFGFVKLRYRGLEKNRNRLFSACASDGEKPSAASRWADLRLKQTTHQETDPNQAHSNPTQAKYLPATT